MSSDTLAHLQLCQRKAVIAPSFEAPSATCPEVTPDGYPRFRLRGGSLSLNGEIALGYLALGYRPIPLMQDDNGSWIPAVKWAPFRRRPTARQEVIQWWMKYPNIGIAQVCGREVLDVNPRHGRVDPKLSAPACSTPRGGIHYHFVAPASIPQLAGPGLEWLGDGHIARVPPTPGVDGHLYEGDLSTLRVLLFSHSPFVNPA